MQEPSRESPVEITAELVYTIDTGVKPVNESFGPGDLQRRDVGALESRPMRIRDGRPLASQLSLDLNGFVLVEHATRVADFFDKGQLATVYYPEIEALVKRVSGAQRVVVFDHTLLPHRFAVIQVWRAINQPIQRNPLAIADARSLAPRDLIISERRYSHRVGEVYRVSYNPDHAWFYFPQMRRDEALVFKVYDSETDGRARFTAHTSFHDPTTPPDAPPRQSIEIRTLAFFAPR